MDQGTINVANASDLALSSRKREVRVERGSRLTGLHGTKGNKQTGETGLKV